MSQLNEVDLVGAIWGHIKYFIHDRADRTEAATQLIELLHDLGVSDSAIDEIADNDTLLRNAMNEFKEMETEPVDELDDFDFHDDYSEDDDDE